MTEQAIHICAYEGRYKIEKRGRKWLAGRRVDGPKAYVDQILINPISVGWNVGDVIEFSGLHHDIVSQFGHNVKLIPVELGGLTDEALRQAANQAGKNATRLSELLNDSQLFGMQRADD